MREDKQNFLYLESQITHTSKVSLNKLFTVFLSLFKNTLISRFLGFRASTTGLKGFSVLTDRKHAGMC
jgi:hypothetical protein